MRSQQEVNSIIRQLCFGLKPLFPQGSMEAILFGSYARGEADEESDVDLLVDLTGTQVKGVFSMTSPWSLGGLYSDLEEALGKRIDLLTVGALEKPEDKFGRDRFRDAILKERVRVYGTA